MANRLESHEPTYTPCWWRAAASWCSSRYLGGTDEIYDRPIANATFDADTLHDMKSVSKSVASLVLGIAIDRGFIRSVDEPIFSFFPELSDLRTPEKDGLRLLARTHHVDGSEVGGSDPEHREMTTTTRRALIRPPDPCRYVLGLPSTAPPGQEFLYNTGALEAAVGHHRQGDRTAARRICTRDVVRASGHHRLWSGGGTRGYRYRRRVAPAAARHGKDRPARPRGRQLERSPDCTRRHGSMPQ